MYKAISKRVVTRLISQQTVKDDEREIYEYSFEVLLSMLVSILCVLCVSILVKKVLLSALFLLGFLVARSCCGGYHAKHQLTCLITTAVNYLAFLTALALTQPVIKLAVLIMACISILIIFLFAPVEHKYNPLSEAEKKRHRRRSRALVLIYSVVGALLLYKNLLVNEVFSVGFGIFSVAFSVLLAKVEKSAEQHVKKNNREVT